MMFFLSQKPTANVDKSTIASMKNTSRNNCFKFLRFSLNGVSLDKLSLLSTDAKLS